MAQPNPKAKLGEGGRFAALKQKLAKKGVNNPGAVAASIGRKKYGNDEMTHLSEKGKRDAKK